MLAVEANIGVGKFNITSFAVVVEALLTTIVCDDTLKDTVPLVFALSVTVIVLLFILIPVIIDGEANPLDIAIVMPT